MCTIEKVLGPRLEPRDNSTTIQTSENSPLISLEECIQPLKFLNKPIDQMVWTVKQKFQSVDDNLILEESASIMLLSMEVDPHHDSLYAILNETLRDDDTTKLEP